MLDHLVIAVVDQGPPRQQFVRPGQQLLVLGLVREGVGRRLARLGAVTIPQVELQACQESREPAAIHQQVPVLSESDLAPKEFGEVLQPQLHAPDQDGRCRGRVVTAEPVHGPIDYLERSAAEVGCLRLPGQLQDVDQIPLLRDDEVLRTSQVCCVWSISAGGSGSTKGRCPVRSNTSHSASTNANIARSIPAAGSARSQPSMKAKSGRSAARSTAPTVASE